MYSRVRWSFLIMYQSILNIEACWPLCVLFSLLFSLFLSSFLWCCSQVLLIIKCYFFFSSSQLQIKPFLLTIKTLFLIGNMSTIIDDVKKKRNIQCVHVIPSSKNSISFFLYIYSYLMLKQIKVIVEGKSHALFLSSCKSK